MCYAFISVSVRPEEEPGAATAHVNNINMTSPGKSPAFHNIINRPCLVLYSSVPGNCEAGWKHFKSFAVATFKIVVLGNVILSILFSIGWGFKKDDCEFIEFVLNLT